MKAHLLFTDHDLDHDLEDPPGAADLEQDLELGYLLDVMGGGDDLARSVARTVLLHPLTDPAAILYRQAALRDAARHLELVEELFELTQQAIEAEHGVLFFLTRNSRPEVLRSRAVSILRNLLPVIDELRAWSARAATDLSSPAFQDFTGMIRAELDDPYVQRLRSAVTLLDLHGGLLMSAGLGPIGEITGQVLRRPRGENRRLFSRVPLRGPTFSFTVPERDEAGHDALAMLRDRSLNEVANAASQAVDHVIGFFRAVRTELAFYLGAVRLLRRLEELRVPVTQPVPQAAGQVDAAAVSLRDPSLALRLQRPPVGNDVRLGANHVLVITGANHGGKSTTLRSLGVAQVMMQAGLFVTAEAFQGPLHGRTLTHWAREEDERLEHGKFDEELTRMRTIVDALRPGDLLLSNESFAATDHGEGAAIALEVITALVHCGVDVRLVTHLVDLAETLWQDGEPATFLRAPRSDGGNRAYRLEEAPPLRTSWGLDLFDEVFGTHLGSSPTPEAADG